ncbi:MAG: alkaline phosphatase family protein [Candidatus Binatia bacterium]|nr:alkaline phosphatase family protein [Candidatus Binatia bacterium]
MIRRRVLVIGLDGAPASLLLGGTQELFPNLHRLARAGQFGVLRSCDPPITVPAWACMLSGRDPGELGLYGFRHRYGHGYADQELVHSGLLPLGMLWDWVGERGGRVILLGVPPAYPPPRLDGVVVSCLLTPGGTRPRCEPSETESLLSTIAPDYRCDIADFRSTPDAVLLEQAVCALRARFRVARELARREPWDLFVLTDIGSDRVQHGLWGASGDNGHPGAEVHAYYQQVDAEIGVWTSELPDDVCIWIVSDHGAQRCRGGVFLNEWLRRRGWLRLVSDTIGARSLTPKMVDWHRTRAWAEGGYVGRIYLNVRGRQAHGTVDHADVDRVCEDLRAALCADLAEREDGRVPILASRPQEIYRDCRGFPPDLLVYVDGLRWRVFGGVGVHPLWSEQNDFGRDRANHHHDGVFIAWDPHASSYGFRGVLPLVSLRGLWERQLLGEPAEFLG